MAAVLQPLPKDCGQLRLFSKRCCDCGLVKDLEEFHFCARAPDHRQYRCRPCRAEYDRRRRVIVLMPAVTAPLLWKPPSMMPDYQSHMPMEATGS